MGFDVGRTAARGLRHSVIGACAAGLVMGCAGVDRELLEELFDGHGHHGGGHGHGHGHGGSGGGGGQNDCPILLTFDDVYGLIAQDLASLDNEDQATTRYITIANQANALGSCSPVLEQSRLALQKAVNSLSIDTTISQLVPIDANLTTYRVDLEDYGWDEPVQVGDTVHADAWEALIASTPHAFEFSGDDAEDAKADTGTSVPLLFGDAFVTAASSPPLYYALLGIGDNVDDFILNDLAIDVAANRTDQEVVRAGLGGTGISRFEFLAERHEIEVRLGSLWQIFSDPDAAAELVESPSSTPDSEERELVFTLPNGLLAHALADASGQRLDASALTLDTFENDFAARIARTYTNFRSQGVTVTDEIRQFVLDNASDFDPDELEQTLATYPPEDVLNEVLDDDRASLAGALARAGLDIDAPDPIAPTARGFLADVDLATAAGELGVTPEELEDNLNLLNPALQVLDGGRIDRGDFETFYLDSLCILNVFGNNAPDPELCAEAAGG